ncbi:hypothetical protein ACWGQL_01320 [Streptomyces lydicus]
MPRQTRQLPSWLMWASLPLSIFYLFVFPVLVASRPEPGIAGIVGACFALFLVAQAMLLAAIWAIESLCALYGVRPRPLRMLHRILSFGQPASNPEVSPNAAAFLAVISYAISTYVFSVIYLFLSQRRPKAFGVGQLDTFDAFYYGISTAVTYSDLDPKASLAKILVLGQLLLGFGFALFLFSLIAGAMQAARMPEAREEATPSAIQPDAPVRSEGLRTAAIWTGAGVAVFIAARSLRRRLGGR